MDADNVTPAPVTQHGQYPAAPPAYVAFYRENYGRMMRIVMHAGAAWHEADELTSQTLTQILRGWGEIKDPLAWASKGLINNLIKYRQSERRRMIRQGKYLADTFERPSDHADIWGDAAAVDELLAVLTSNQRAVVENLLQGLSQEEVALLLGKSYEAVRRSLSDIRRRLESHCRHQGRHHYLSGGIQTTVRKGVR